MAQMNPMLKIVLSMNALLQVVTPMDLVLQLVALMIPSWKILELTNSILDFVRVRNPVSLIPLHKKCRYPQLFSENRLLD